MCVIRGGGVGVLLRTGQLSMLYLLQLPHQNCIRSCADLALQHLILSSNTHFVLTQIVGSA